MNSDVAESLWVWCYLNSISKVFDVTYSHFSIFGFWWIFVISEFSFLGVSYNENPKITESLFSGLHFHHYFNCFSMKTDINKSRLNLIYSVGSDLIFRFNIFNVGESFWEWCRLNSISSVFEVVYLFSVFWGFSSISGISKFSFLGIGLKTKTQKLQKIIIFRLLNSNTCGSLLRFLF